MSELYIGLISGTSMDGADAALVDFSGDTPRLVHAVSGPYDPELLDALRRLARSGHEFSADFLAATDAALGEHFAVAALRLLEEAGVSTDDVAAIGSHGQTVAHDPSRRPHGFTLQIGDPSRIAERTGITTVADFRRRDVAAGGQGAPLMTAFHAAYLRDRQQNVAVLNLGGIANLTLLPGETDADVTGFDTGPGNCLLDAWARRHLDQDYDHSGDWAASGRVDASLLERLLLDPYFAQVPPKSTGTQHFGEAWLERRLGDAPIEPTDVAATLVALTARSVAMALRETGFTPDRLLVCGGGVHNATLMDRLRMELPGTEVVSTESAGIHPDWMEAIGFAWLAKETLAGRPGSLHTVTGAAGDRVLGAVYPGNGAGARK